MVDSMLVADQVLPDGFLASLRAPARPGAAMDRPEITQGPPAYEFLKLGARPFVVYGPGTPFAGNDRNLESRLVRQRALESLERSRRRAEIEGQYREEMAWLADNHHRYAGQWLALEGARLLASGATSREVFEQIGDRPVPPLVIRIDEVELPFAGW